jgi:hypothetical protein
MRQTGNAIASPFALEAKKALRLQNVQPIQEADLRRLWYGYSGSGIPQARQEMQGLQGIGLDAKPNRSYSEARKAMQRMRRHLFRSRQGVLQRRLQASKRRKPIGLFVLPLRRDGQEEKRFDSTFSVLQQRLPNGVSRKPGIR